MCLPAGWLREDSGPYSSLEARDPEIRHGMYEELNGGTLIEKKKKGKSLPSAWCLLEVSSPQLDLVKWNKQTLATILEVAP